MSESRAPESLAPESRALAPITRSRSGSWVSSFFPGTRGVRLIERHARFYRKLWLGVSSGAAELAFYPASVRVGLGALIGDLGGAVGQPVPYRELVAPGLLAVSALNGALNDATFNIYG